MAVILISHDLGLAASYADDVVVMYAGRAVERAPAGQLFAHVRMPYTRALLGAIPRLEREPHSLLPVIPGQPPDLSALPGRLPVPAALRLGHRRVRWNGPPFAEHEPGHWWACWHPLPDTQEDARDHSRRRPRRRGPSRCCSARDLVQEFPVRGAGGVARRRGARAVRTCRSTSAPGRRSAWWARPARASPRWPGR